MEISYWEKTQMLQCDFAVIGSGITGLSTAIELKEKYPESSVWILEKGGLPSGASTRNAGFACFGSLTELKYDLDQYGSDEMLGLVERRYKGLEILKNRLGEKKIKYEDFGGFELITEKEEKALIHLEEMNQYLSGIFGKEVFKERKDLVKTFGFDQEKVKTLVWNQLEGQINTGAMMRALLDLAGKMGVHIWTGATVSGIESSEKQVEIAVRLQERNEEIKILARNSVVCGNAFCGQFIPELKNEIIPGRGLVLLTAPIPHLPFRGAFHYDEGFYYFRDLDGRLLIGGGRNLDVAGETTFEAGSNPRIRESLLKLVNEVILPGQKPIIEMEWSGIMGFGSERKPILRKISPNLVVVARLGGMGVALGSLLGKEAADLI
jgi:glycine/D-amino acid oxidase-like deaminating enzyme